MKSFVLIVTVLLSFISGGDRASYASGRSVNCTDAAVRCSGDAAADNTADLNDSAILPVRTASYTGDSGSFAPSLRSASSSRRVQPSTKSSFRVIKAGKVFDRTNLYTFRAVILQFQCGIRSNSRYIYSICRLLI